MAYFYVKDDGTAETGTATGDGGRYASKKTGDWSTAFSATTEYYASLGAALAATTVPVDGDFILISDLTSTSYDNLAILSVNYTGSQDSTGLIIISVDDTACENYKPGAHDNRTGGDQVRLRKNVASYGVKYQNAGANIWATNESGGVLSLTDTTLVLPTVNDDAFSIGHDGCVFTLTNVDIDAAGSTNSLLTGLGEGSKFEWNGGAITGANITDLLGNVPIGDNGFAEVIITGVDLSKVTGTLYRTPTSSAYDRSLMRLTNCQLNSAVTLVGTLVRKNHRFEMFGCDDSTGNKLHRFYIEDGLGSAKNNDSAYVTATEVWYEGSDKSSIQVDTKANCSHTIPFVFELPAQYVNLGSTSTDVLTIDMVTAETLVKSDISAFLVYPDKTTAVIPRWKASGPSVGTGNYGSDPLDSSTAMPASALGAGDWTGEPGSPNFYELVLDTSGTPGQATAVGIRIEVYKDLTNPVYIHPLITVSAT